MSELIQVFGKASVILLFGALVAIALRHSTAALRHAVWSSTLAGLVLLPLSLQVMPAWRVAMIPSYVTGWRDVSNNSVSDVPVGSIDATRMLASQTSTGEVPGSTSHTSASGNTKRAGADGVSARSARKPGPVAWLYLVWLIGTTAVLARLLLGRFALARVARRARPVNEVWQQALERERHHARVRRHVRIGQTHKVSTPITFGSIRPVILLPDGADDLSLDRMSVILRHEVAHIARHDVVTQLIGTIACAMYWPHPGTWYAARQLRIHREAACDDIVLAQGTPPADYADHLLDVARIGKRGRTASLAAVAMACPSHFEGRLLAILDETRRRGRAGSAAVPLLASVLAIVAIAGAFVPVQARANTRVPTTTNNNTTPPSSTIQNAMARATETPAAKPIKPVDTSAALLSHAGPGEIQIPGTPYFVRDAAMRIDQPGELVVWEPLPNGGWLTSQNNIGVRNSIGPLYMRTTHGSIHVENTSGNTYAFTDRGSVDISFLSTSPTSDVVIESKHGSVELTLPASMGATFDLETSYDMDEKAVAIQGPAALQQSSDAEWKTVGDARVKTVRATGKIGDGKAKIRVRTRSGDIVIRQR
jgi:beta-lactamase regulating signal transducer with metallopeptidase domain